MSETWLLNSDPSALLNISNFVLYRCDRPYTVNRGGGIAFYVKRELASKVTLIDNSGVKTARTAVEVLGLMLKLDTPLAIIAVYRLPYNVKMHYVNVNASLRDNFDILKKLVTDTLLFKSDIVCIRDFNIDLCDSNSSSSVILREFIDFFNFKQIIKSHTRVTDCASSLIDLILVAEDVKTTNTNVIEVSNDSVSFDHCMIMTDLVINKLVNRENLVLKRNLSAIIEIQFASAEQINWNEVLDEVDLDSKVELFSTIIIDLFDKFAPQV